MGMSAGTKQLSGIVLKRKDVFADHRRSWRILFALLAVLVSAFAAGPAQAASPAYVYTSDGKTFARDMHGHCIRTIEWRKELAVEGCDGGQVQAAQVKKAEPAPAPKAEPQPAPAAAPAPQPADSDHDGVPDSIDKCPDTPKGVKVDKDGCPETVAMVDSDGDGVADAADKCADTPQGVKVDKNGCPIDSDGDGVPDYLDKCPDTPKGKMVDKDGCVTGKVSISLEVAFDSGKTTIKQQYHEPIKKVADFMKTYPETTAVIGGYTDNVGSKESNERLSARRAESVRKYLIEKFGIASDRVTAKGYGPANPIADNATPEGRAKNRRIEAVIEASTKQ